MTAPLSLNSEAKKSLDRLTTDLEQELDADVLMLVGPLRDVTFHLARYAVEAVSPTRRTKLAVVLHTGGGDVVVAERLVGLIRHWYAEVVFIVPDRALSAGTILAMSGDAILMDYASCLGPIDPQIEKNGTWVPALSYLIQYERLVEKSQKGIPLCANVT